MLWNECARRMRRSIFWIMSVLIGILIFISMFSQLRQQLLWRIEEILAGDTIGLSLVNYEQSLSLWGSFVSYAIPCCCVCAVAGGAVEDIECNRYNYMLPRSGCLRYAVCNIAGVSIVSFLCMLIGNIIYYAATLLVVKVPLFQDVDIYSNYTLIAGGHYFLFLFLRIMVVSLFGVFMTLLAMTLALWIHDRNIVVIFPAILMYFFWYVLDFSVNSKYGWTLRFFFPKYVYMWHILWGDNLLGWCGYAFIHTLVVEILATAILYVRVRRWRRG